jgi:O-Antigen ligase
MIRADTFVRPSLQKESSSPYKKILSDWLPAVSISGILIFLTLYYSSGMQGLRVGKMLALICASGFLWGWIVGRYVTPSAGYLMIVATISSVGAGFGEIHARSLVFAWSAGAIVLIASKMPLKTVHVFLWALLATGIVEAIHGYLQMAGLDPIFERTSEATSWIPVGTLGQQTLYGPFMVCACATALFLAPMALVLLLPVTVATCSSMTFVSLGMVLVIYLYYQGGIRWIAYASVAAALTLSILAILGCINPLFDDHGRYELWGTLLSLWKNKPFFGYGIGSFQLLGPLAEPQHLVKEHGYFLQAHNDYLQVLFETGILGAFGVLWALASVIRATIKNIKSPTACLLASIFGSLAANALASFPFHIAPLAFLGLVSWALLVTLRHKEKDAEV